MSSLGPPELIIIAVVIMLLFGAKKMPDAARSLGRSLRIFKAETKGLRDDDLEHKQSAQTPPPASLPSREHASTDPGQAASSRPAAEEAARPAPRAEEQSPPDQR